MSSGKKVKQLQYAQQREKMQKIFWQRLCKFYAPNRMQQHYDELDAELLKFEKEYNDRTGGGDNTPEDKEGVDITR